MNEQLFIPEVIRFGGQKRQNCFTGVLGYIIYYDKTGKLRKETSWESWRHNDIEPVNYDNVPTEGFVLNKKVGGTKESYGWDTRQEYCRVYDPRGFEFEITIPNLLFILQECSSVRGKGLEGKFVYSWSGTSLVLLPVDCEEYRKSTGFTELQGKTVSAKELIPGATYITKKQEALVYVGRFDYYEWNGRYNSGPERVKTRKHVFRSGDNFLYQSDIKNIASLVNGDTVENYAFLVDEYNKSECAAQIKSITPTVVGDTGLTENNSWYNSTRYLDNGDGTFTKCYYSYVRSGVWDIGHGRSSEYKWFSGNKVGINESGNLYVTDPDDGGYDRYGSRQGAPRLSDEQVRQLSELKIELENGYRAKLRDRLFVSLEEKNG
jgi:hypothetical protein